MTTTLDVWLEAYDQPVGTLGTKDDGSLVFAYSPGYVAAPDAHPISLSLPLVVAPFDDLATRAFFLNLLPENNQLDQLLARERLERSDIAGILFHLGADLSGALSCLPAGSSSRDWETTGPCPTSCAIPRLSPVTSAKWH